MRAYDQPYSNAAGHLTVATRFRVRFYETDQMGVVHHSVYIRWFEEGRSAFTRALGYPYSRMEAEGVSLAVTDVQARYLHSARYDDEVAVICTLEEFLSRGMTFGYEVRRAADDALLVTGRTRHISMDHKGRVVRFSETMREGLLAGAVLLAAQP